MAAIDRIIAEPHTMMVTGVNGFIGARLCKLLFDRGYSVNEITRSHIIRVVMIGKMASPRSSSSCNVRLNETGGQDGQAIQKRRNSQNTQGSRANGLGPGCDPKIQCF